MAVTRYEKINENLEEYADYCIFLGSLLTKEEYDILQEKFKCQVKDYKEYPWYKFILDNVGVSLKGED